MGIYNGTSGNDSLVGSTGDDTINGFGGADLLLGGTGADTIDGGDDADIVADNDIYLSNGVAVPIADTSRDVLRGGGGDDYLLGGLSDVFDGGSGVDAAMIDLSPATSITVDLTPLNGGGTAVLPSSGSITSVEGGIAIFFGIGTNTAIGSQYVEEFYGWTGIDNLDGGGGNDYLDGWAGDDTLSGGDGADTVLGGDDADILNGGAGNDALNGEAGNDQVNGGGGDDTIISTSGVDSIDGGDGVDLLRIYNVSGLINMVDWVSSTPITLSNGTSFRNMESFDLSMGLGADTVIVLQPIPYLRVEFSLGSDTLIVDFSSRADTISQFTPFDLNINNGLSQISFNSVETLRISGGSGRDQLRADGGDQMSGGGGDDVVDGFNGGNVLNGGDGDDRLYSWQLGDTIDGGAGVDYVGLPSLASTNLNGISFSTSAMATETGVTFGGTTVRNVEILAAFIGTPGDDTLIVTVPGANLSDVLAGSVMGAGGFDTFVLDLSGSTTDQSLLNDGIRTPDRTLSVDFERRIYTTGSGNDTLEGYAYDDVLNGGAGNDQLIGWNGADLLIGGVGNDRLNGGDGVDTASYASAIAGVTVSLSLGAQDTIGAGVDTLISIEAVTGSAFGDTLRGNAEANSLLGESGNDALYGDAGADTLAGGVDDDILDGGAGADALDGGAGSDAASYADASAAVSVFMSDMGSNAGDAAGDAFVSIENLIGSNWNDTLRGDDAANAISGGLGNDVLAGGAGNDRFDWVWGDGADAIDGGADTDALYVTGDAAANVLSAAYDGAALTSVVDISTMNLEIINANMAAGTDWLVYSASAAVIVNLATGSASGFASVANIENVVGGTGADALTGNGLANRLDGGAGDDTLSGASGADTLIGGEGNDTLIGGLDNDSIQGGAGDDTFSWAAGEGRDTFNGGGGADVATFAASAGADLLRANWSGSAITGLLDCALIDVETIQLSGGSGVDWLIYNASAAVTVDLSTGAASGFASISNIERVIGGSGGDTLTGDGVDNRLDGQGGADTLNGGAGFDTVLGGDGDDVIYASAGNDSLQGQNGVDTFYWTSADGRDVFNGGADTDTLYLAGSAVADVADANWNGAAITGLLNNALIDIENINLDLGAGGSGGDWLRYNTSAAISVNLATGTATGFASITGVENLIGGSAGDTLLGDGGVNKINGAAGDDIITGGAGNDSLTGGLGADTFVYAAGAGADTVLDFDAWADGGQDFIDVSALGINATNFAARVTIIDTGADTVVRIDSDIFITLKNVSGDGDNVITQADFILGA